jgi:hypothetical protein
MKIVQIGILVVLIAVGALLFMVWRGQSNAQPDTVTSPAVQTTESAPAAPAEPAVAQPQAAVPAEPARPSPASRTRSAAKPVEMANAPAPAMAAEAQPAQPEQTASSAPPPPDAHVSEPPAASAPPPPPPPQTVTVTAGTLLSTRLGETLSTDKLVAGDSFTGTLDRPLVVDGLVIAERGARVEGRVIESEKAGRVKGVSSLSIHLIRLRTSDGQSVQITTDPFRKLGETSRAEDVKKVGIGAGLGAVIGAIAGGGKGAAIGAGVGGAAGGGAVAATRGEPVVLPVETRIDFRLSSPVSLTESKK